MKTKMKSLLKIYTVIAIMGDFGYKNKPEYAELTDEEKAEIKAIIERKRIEKLKKQSVKEYFYGQKIIYARKKNADKKARNKGYL